MNCYSLKSILIIVVLFLVGFQSYSQISGKNLVPNSSFENFKGRTPKPIIRSAYPWVNFGTVDFFHRTHTKDKSPFKGAHSGKCYAAVRFQSKYNEYAYVKLKGGKLVEGQTYFFSMYVRLSETSTASIEQIGIYFSENPLRAGMEFEDDNLIDSTYLNGLVVELGWMPITGKYTANGTEQYLIVGNLNSNFIKTDGNKGLFTLKEAYYYIDDIVLLDSTYKSSEILSIDTKVAVITKPPIFNEGDLKQIYFEKDSLHLIPKSISVVNQITALLKSNITLKAVMVGRFTSNIKDDDAKLLLQKRIKAIQDYLEDQGVSCVLKDNNYALDKYKSNAVLGKKVDKNSRIDIYIIKDF